MVRLGLALLLLLHGELLQGAAAMLVSTATIMPRVRSHCCLPRAAPQMELSSQSPEPVVREEGVRAAQPPLLVIGGVGAIAVGLVVALIIGLASALGWDLALSASSDNRGLGTPLSTREAAALLRSARQGPEVPSGSDDTELTLEELREEQALIGVIRGVDIRAR